MILTDEEIKTALDSVSACIQDRDIVYSRAIEQATINKLSEQEPIGWQGHSGHLVYDKKSLLPSTRHLAKPIYLHPAPSVPEGYQLVPIEPTKAMMWALYGHWVGQLTHLDYGYYKAMLSAARSE